MKTWKAFCPMMKGVCNNGFVKGMPETDDGDRTLCAFFVKLAGRNPQTDEIVDDPGCSIAFLPIIMLEGNQHTRQVAASTDKVATEVRRQHGTLFGALSSEAKIRLLEVEPCVIGKGE